MCNYTREERILVKAYVTRFSRATALVVPMAARRMRAEFWKSMLIFKTRQSITNLIEKILKSVKFFVQCMLIADIFMFRRSISYVLCLCSSLHRRRGRTALNKSLWTVCCPVQSALETIRAHNVALHISTR
jgi:hypothetical protein